MNKENLIIRAGFCQNKSVPANFNINEDVNLITSPNFVQVLFQLKFIEQN